MKNLRETNIKKIKQKGVYDGLTFQEGDILKVEIETNGTKNVYIGKFICFDIAKLFGYFITENSEIIMVFRHHTLCSEGLFRINTNRISKIEVLKRMENKIK